VSLVWSRAWGFPLAVFVTMGLPGSQARADDDPIAQCISASDRGLDLRKQGKLIEARRVLLSCAATACGPDISSVCQKRLADINATLPSIVFSPKDAAGNDVAGVRVTVDGAPEADTIDGRAIVLDPGPHTFKFEVPGQPAIERSFVLVEGAKDRQEHINMAPNAPAAPSAAVNAPVSVTPSDSGSSGRATQQAAGLWVGGLGVAAVAAGSVFGVLAKLKWSASRTDCETSSSCANHDQAVSEHDAAVTDATVSTATCTVGGAAVITGALLLLTLPHEAPRSGITGARLRLTPSVGPGNVALSIDGVFR
jgi:hypothetical protein